MKLESIENFIENKLRGNELNEFKSKCLSKIYDEKFSCRLLIRLRDYTYVKRFSKWFYIIFNKR